MKSRLDMVRDIELIYNLHSPKVLQALVKFPREEFVPKKYRNIAYEDTAISIGEGQTVSQPFTVAFMTDLLDLKGTERVLEIGTGSGYQAAILSFLVRDVYTIERIKKMAERARNRFKKLNIENIKIKTGQGEKGWKEHAPFDAVIITANTREIPQTLFDQLKVEGKLIAPIGKGTSGVMTKFIKDKDKIRKTEHGEFLFVPLVTF